MFEPPSSGGGSSAISALNAFSQNNDPQRNHELDSVAEVAASAARTLALRGMGR